MDIISANGETITSQSLADWMIREEPALVKKLYDHFFQTDEPVSFDGEENRERMKKVSEHIGRNAAVLYEGLNRHERFLISIMANGFGWIVYENSDATLHIIARIFRLEIEDLKAAVDSLFKKFLLLKYERLKLYNFLFTPPVFLRNVRDLVRQEETLRLQNGGVTMERRDLSSYQHIALIAGIISYIVTYSPRSSESNEIHKIDLTKMVDFFADFSERENVEAIIKKLSRFGFFRKVNNRIIINKELFDTILGLTINEQLFIIFLYDFMDKFDFKQSAFMTLKVLANQNEPVPLRELFFYYLNNETYVALKNEMKSVKLMLQQEELKFIFFIKNLEAENCIQLSKKDPERISIGQDYVLMNEPHRALLGNRDFASAFSEEKFIVEPNYEVIVEPYLKPSVLFKLALFTEPMTAQTISIFRITKESIFRSFAYGIARDEVLEFLREHSRHALPQNVVDGIQSFLQDLSMEKLGKYRIVQVPAHSSIMVKDHFKNRLIEVEPHTFLIFDAEVMEAFQNFCRENHLVVRPIEDFLNQKYQSSYLKNSLDHNIRHLHKMKDFFDFYGNIPMGNNIKIDNKI
jgi:hypothetical protein